MSTVDISNTFGPAFIGSIITAVLYGITTLQTYLYYAYYPRDHFQLKLLVAAICVLDTVQIALVCHAMYYYLISNYMRPAALVDGTWSLYTSIAINFFIAFVVQCFFLKCIILLTKSRVGKICIGSITGVVVVAHLAFRMETVGALFVKKALSRLGEIKYVAATPFAVFAVLSDVLVAGALSVLLHKSRTEFKNLMVYAINRCLLTSVVAIVETISYATLPNTLWFLGIDFTIGKLYANSLLASLNTRHVLRGRGTDSAGEHEPTFAASMRFVSLDAGAHSPVSTAAGMEQDAMELENIKAVSSSSASATAARAGRRVLIVCGRTHRAQIWASLWTW